MNNQQLYDFIDTQVKQRFGTWKNFEKSQGMSARNGKRIVISTIRRLTDYLRPLGVRVHFVEDQFPSTLAEKLSVTTPFPVWEIEPLVKSVKAYYGFHQEIRSDDEPIVIEKVTQILEEASSHAISLNDARNKILSK